MSNKYLRSFLCLFCLAFFVFSCFHISSTARADTTAQPIPFSQDWSNVGLITVNNDWSNVPAAFTEEVI